MSPKKTDTNKVDKKEKNNKKAVKKSTSAKKNNSTTTVKKNTTVKKGTTSKSPSTTKKTSTKQSSTKKTSTVRKNVGKKTSAVVRKKSTAKKTTAHRKAVSAKRTPKKQSKKVEELVKNFPLSEYYDLPEKYTQTVVKVLAQTPDTLFIYWDISDDDRKRFEEVYGQSFFTDTKPVLIITNKTMNYTFEVDINDFANCWYLHVNDAKCDYSVELGRRPISNINIPDNYLYVSSSNVIEAPNNHILLEKKQSMVYFRNVKTNVISSKPMTSLTFLKNLGKFYDIYEFYDKAYAKEDFSNASKLMGNSSSVMK